MYKMLSVLCLACLLVAAQDVQAVTSNSLTWEGSYECGTLPTAAGWSAAGAYEASWTSVADGVLTMTPTAPTNPGWWEKPSNLNFTTGSTMEWRAKVNSVSPVDVPYCAYLRFNDTAGNLADLGYDNTGSGYYLSGLAPGGMTQFDFTGWHTYRMTVQNQNISLYIDNNPVAVITGSTANYGATNIFFGDCTWTTVSANWNLDYLRWTNQGAFAAPEPATMCLLGLGLLGLRRSRK